MPRRTVRPAIGTKMYDVREHLYYIPGRAAPVLEYVVVEETVTGFYKGGYEEVCLIGCPPDRGNTPISYPLKDIGKKVFYTPKEAAFLAKERTEKEENILLFRYMKHPPLRRTWEKYLKET